jgi:soluble lytic murein transglycosylase-like protein
MSLKPATMRVVIVCALLLLCGDLVSLQAQRRRRHQKKSSAQQIETAEEETPQAGPTEVRLKLVDGSRMIVDEAWESEQGFWYKRAGITYLATRDKATGIERGKAAVPKTEPQVAKVTQANPQPQQYSDGPAWIYLKGGARVEADSATESASGVWYRRESLSIFIDRSRIDRVEREDPDKIAKSDNPKERGWSTGSSKLDALIRQNGSRHGVDPYLIFLVMEQESHFNSHVVSPAGARGLMQLMPGTGARFGVRRPFDPAQNIAGGTRYLRQLLDRFNGRVDLVLASYNAGEGAVIRYGHRVPPYRETRNYVKTISKRYRRAKSPVVSPTATSPAVSGGN